MGPPPPTLGRSRASAPSLPVLMESVQPRECLRGMRAHLALLQGHIGDKLARQWGQGLEIPGTRPRMRSQLSYDFVFPPSCSVLGFEPPGLLRVGCPSFPPVSRPRPRVGGWQGAAPGPGLGQDYFLEGEDGGLDEGRSASDSHQTGQGVHRRGLDSGWAASRGTGFHPDCRWTTAGRGPRFSHLETCGVA